jgi:hypothetical protein
MYLFIELSFRVVWGGGWQTVCDTKIHYHASAAVLDNSIDIPADTFASAVAMKPGNAANIVGSGKALIERYFQNLLLLPERQNLPK